MALCMRCGRWVTDDPSVEHECREPDEYVDGDELAVEDDSDENTRSPRKRRPMTTLEKARKYLTRHAGEAVSHRQLAAAVGVCRRQAIRVSMALRRAGGFLLDKGPRSTIIYRVTSSNGDVSPVANQNRVTCGVTGDTTGDTATIKETGLLPIDYNALDRIDPAQLLATPIPSDATWDQAMRMVNAKCIARRAIANDDTKGDAAGDMLGVVSGDKTGDIVQSPRVQRREEKRREENRELLVAQKITDDDGLRAAIARKREELRRISGEEAEAKPAAETAPGSIAAPPANAQPRLDTQTPAARAVAPQVKPGGSGGRPERTPEERAALRAAGLRALGLPGTAVQDGRGVAHAIAARMGCDEHFTPYLATLAGKTFSNVLGLLEAFGEWLGIAKWIRNPGGWLRQKLRKMGVILRTMYDVRRDLLRRGPR